VAVPLWSSLEVAKLIVSAVTPVVVVGLGVVVSRAARRLEHTDWANRVLIERRLALYSEMAPLLNDLYCFFRFVGHFRDIAPPDAIERKRGLDKTFFINRFLMDAKFSILYSDFMNSCFETYTGAGQGVKLRGTRRIHRLQREFWEEAWNDCYVTDSSKVVSPGTIEVRYEALMSFFAREIGVGSRPKDKRNGISNNRSSRRSDGRTEDPR
jgi:hypothetical protein